MTYAVRVQNPRIPGCDSVTTGMSAPKVEKVLDYYRTVNPMVRVTWKEEA